MDNPLQSGHDTNNQGGGRSSLTKKHSWDMIKIKANTASGEETAHEGDTINYSQPNSKTRRGRVGVGVGVVQTLDTQVNQAVVIAQRGRENGQQLEQSAGDYTNTLTGVQKDNMLLLEGNIRRLTEIECERLQGFPDNWTKYGVYEKQVWINKKEKTFRIIEGVEEISRTQRYKMCGNAVTTNIVQLIGIKLLNQ